MNKKNDVIINVDHVSKIYRGKGGNTTALKDISFSIYRGDVIGYVGENGAGKSTMIKLLLGLILPTEGKVSVFGNNSYKKRMANATKIGVVMGQKSQLWWELPLEDSFAFLKSIYNTHDDEWLALMIDKLNVRDFINKPVRELSLGQKMRGELIVALIHHPELVILDEATIGLDSHTKNVLLNFLVELNHKENVTIFMTTHDLREVERVANHIILIDGGEKIYSGLTNDFMAQYDHLQKLTLYSQKEMHIDGLETYQSNIDSTIYIFDKNQYSPDELNKLLSDAGIFDNKKYEPLDLTDILSLKSGVLK